MLVRQLIHELGPNPKAETIVRVLNVDASINPYVVGIYNDTRDWSTLQREAESQTYYDDSWLAFNEVVVSFVKLCSQLNPQSVVSLFDLYSLLLSDISVAFGNGTHGGLIAPLMEQMVATVVPMARDLDFQIQQYEADAPNPRLTFIASILLRIFNNVRSQILDTTQTLKQQMLLYVSNKLCYVYFQLGNPLLCRNVFSNITTAGLLFAQFPPQDRLQFRFNLAKFYLVKQLLVDSMRHFQWCVAWCLARERVKVLRYLVPVAMVCGRNPNFGAIEAIGGHIPWLDSYRQLAAAVGQGDYESFLRVLEENDGYFKQVGVDLLLRGKLEVVVLRNLLKSVWKLLDEPTTISYDVIATGLRVLWGTRLPPGGVDDDVVENAVVTLIDQNLCRGKLVPKLRTVVFPKNRVFETVGKVYDEKFTLMLGQDKWLNE